jgi:hypothetical protein
MRGQAYTVMNYLVWAVFAAIFAGIVMVVASKLTTPVEPIFWKETVTVFKSAYQSSVANMGCSCASSNGPIAYSSGFLLSQDMVRKLLCGSDKRCLNGLRVRFYGGTGFRTYKNDTEVMAKKAVRAELTVCCDAYSLTCVAYFNLPGKHDCE